MRLVDADALKENAFEVQTKEYGKVDVVGVDVIDEAPTIDGLVQGEWIFKDQHDDWKEYQCSNCSYVGIVDMMIGEKLPKHCPECGSMNETVIEKGEKYPGMLMFQGRRKLEQLYYEWIEENNIKDCPFSVVSFLQVNNLIKVREAYDFIKKSESDLINIYKVKSQDDSAGAFYTIMSEKLGVIGGFGISVYDNSLGIGNFEIKELFRNKGYGTASIEKIIEMFSEEYGLIYCYVDSGNDGAVRFWERVCEVRKDNTNDEGQYYVEIYRKAGDKNE